MNQSQNLGIKDIAKLANVSIGTVDRVLHNRKGVSKSTREKVLNIISQTGYQKNVVASRLKLASHRKIKIAVLLPEIISDWSYWKHPRVGIKKAVNELEELGISVDFFYFNMSDAHQFNSYCHHILAHDYHGLVTVPFLEESCNRLLQKSLTTRFPVVFLDTESKLDYEGYYIRQNAFDAGMVAGRLLHNLLENDGQYVVIHLTKKGEVQINSLQREEGFWQFFANNFPGEVFQQSTMIHREDEMDTLLQRLLQFSNEPLGIFVSNARAFLLADVVCKTRKTNTHVVGFDLNKWNVECLRKGKIRFLINQKPEYQGYTAIKGLYKYLTQNVDDKLSADIPVEIIIKENLSFQTV